MEEQREVDGGGTCLNRGCIPTKCLCASAERLRAVLTAAEFGIEAGSVKADYAAVHRRAGDIVERLRDDVEACLGLFRSRRDRFQLLLNLFCA